MLRLLVCGSSFHPEEDAQLRCPTRTSTRKSFSRWSRKDANNPYSNRGLDKFSQLVADLDEKRQEIYLQRGSQDIALIRFVNSSSGSFVPVVVKLKDDKKHKAKKNRTAVVTKKEKVLARHSKTSYESSDARKEEKETKLGRHRKDEKKSFSWDKKKSEWSQPSWYLPVVIIIVLLFLAIFGRSFAILCTCIGWYTIPPLTEEKSSLRRTSLKKKYVRRPSEKTISSN